MTLLSVAGEVCKVIGIAVPDTLVNNDARQYVELLSVIKEMAKRISQDHDWRLLATLQTLTGDGSKVDFDLPPNYERMPVAAQLWSSAYQAPIEPVATLDDWLGLETLSFQSVINAWIAFGGQIHIQPALSTGTTVKFFYQSNLIVKPASGDNKVEFTADDDTFRLSEQLLKLATIWRWKEYKGQPYAEDLADCEELKERLIGRDKGARIIATGTRRIPGNVSNAYPGTLGP